MRFLSRNAPRARDRQQIERDLERLVRKHFDLTPRGIVEGLQLLRPIYRATSYHGHFGRENQGFPWEETTKAEALARDAAK